MTIANVSNWQFSHFNQAHWIRVRAARKSQGLPHCGQDEGRLHGHQLVGRQLVDIDGVTHTVTAVDREWCQAYAISLLLESAEGSHSRVYVRGTAAWHSKQIDNFIARFPSAADIIALS